MNSDGIDILKLFVQGNANEWNRFLSHALATHDVSGLTDVLRRLQIGMNNLVQQKLNTEQVSILFLRLQKSVEDTLKKIHREQNQNPLFKNADKSLHKDHLADKRRKNEEFERFLRKVRF